LVQSFTWQLHLLFSSGHLVKMMYKDKEKQKTADRERQRRYRKGVTETPEFEVGVTMRPIEPTDLTRGMTQYPDIIDKLTDPVWRLKLEKICHAFKASSNPHYIHDVWLGDYNLSEVCGLVECTK